MPPRLSVALGLVVGVAVVSEALVWAFARYLKVTPPKAVWPERRDAPQDWGNWQGETLGVSPPPDDLQPQPSRGACNAVNFQMDALPHAR
jgi:hypothetical protein